MKKYLTDRSGGFIGTIILIVIFLLILYFMGIRITDILAWIWGVITWIWHLFLSVL